MLNVIFSVIFKHRAKAKIIFLDLSFQDKGLLSLMLQLVRVTSFVMSVILCALALIATLFTLIVSLLGSSTSVMQFLLPKNHNILGCGKSSRKKESLSHFLYSLGSSKAPSFNDLQ